jgi:hypothetical protein
MLKPNNASMDNGSYTGRKECVIWHRSPDAGTIPLKAQDVFSKVDTLIQG